MDVNLSPVQSAVRERYAALVSDELVPSIRRMAEAPRGGDDPDANDPGADGTAELAEVRAAVWQALTGLGATRALLPEPFCGADRLGQQGAVIVAELLGTALYQGPLLDTMTAGELLAYAPDPDGKLLAEIAQGAAVTLAPRESAVDSHAHPGPIECSGSTTAQRSTASGPAHSGPITITARRRFVAFAADADYLLLPGTHTRISNAPGRAVSGSGVPRLTFALIRRDVAGISLRRHDDVTRGELYDVRVKNAPAVAVHSDSLTSDGPTGSALVKAWPQVLAHARIRHAAYLIGLSQGALDLAIARAGERRQFGQPVGRFQAPAFDLARIAAELEAARWFVYAAAWESDEGADPALSAAQALAMAADLARIATSAAMQIHGAYGTTEQADVQIYYRRACVDRVWLGTPTELRREVLPLLLSTFVERDTAGASARQPW